MSTIGAAAAPVLHERLAALTEEAAARVGMDLHHAAWRASFAERSLPVPDHPREGAPRYPAAR